MFRRLLHLRVQHRVLQEHLQRARIDPDGLVLPSRHWCHCAFLAALAVHSEGENRPQRPAEDFRGLHAWAVPYPGQFFESHYFGHLH